MGFFVETTTTAWFGLLESAYPIIEKTLFAPSETQQTIGLLVERCKYLSKEAKKKEGEAMGLYNPKDFEAFLMALSADPETANYLYKSLKKNNLLDLNVAFVVLKIAKSTNDDKLYAETAEYFSDSDADIAAQLLQKYLGQNDRPNLLRVANKVWPCDRFNDFVIENISTQEDYKLHLQALESKYYPTDCSQLAKKWANDALASGQRGRDLYQRIASRLEVLHKIPELEQNTLQFARYLATEYPRLSALREELRNANLWRK